MQRYVDEWGVGWVKPPDSLFFDLEISPLSKDELSLIDINNYKWPESGGLRNNSELKETLKTLYADSDYALVLNAGSGPLHITQFPSGLHSLV